MFRLFFKPFKDTWRLNGISILTAVCFVDRNQPVVEVYLFSDLSRMNFDGEIVIADQGIIPVISIKPYIFAMPPLE